MKKALIFLHKWLGLGLALLFLMWFATVIVMYVVPFPGLAPEERLVPARRAGRRRHGT